MRDKYSNKSEWKSKALACVVDIYKTAAIRRLFWQRALDTIEEDDLDRKRMAAASLLGATTRSTGWDTVAAIGDDGLHFDERHLIELYEELRHCRLMKRHHDLLDSLGHCVWRGADDFKFIREQFEYELLYGYRLFVEYDEDRTIHIWRQFLDEAEGDLEQALAHSRRWKWECVPEEYLQWYRDKEVMFGSASTWKDALSRFDGDLRRVAASLGLDGYDYSMIVYNFGLSRFADSVRHDRKRPSIQFLVYGLRDPDTNEIRWVGQSKRGMQRPTGMLTASAIRSNRLGCGDWLRSLQAVRKLPEIVVLEECSDVSTLNEAEQRHIARLRSLIGDRLTNIASGGSISLEKHLARLKAKPWDIAPALKAYRGDVEKVAQLFEKDPQTFADQLTSGLREWAAKLNNED